MAFTKKTQLTNTQHTVSPAQKLDSSQIGKLEESGFVATPVSNNPQVLASTTPTNKQVMPGVSVPGFQDSTGNFFVVDEKNTVHNLTYYGDSLNTTGGKMMEGPSNTSTNTMVPNTPRPPAGDFENRPVDKPILPTNPTPPLPPPPPNFGSGRIYTIFESGDIIPNQQETVTRALWSGNVGNLTTFFTSSTQTATQKRYYYEIFNSQSGACGAEAQFSIAYGHKQGSGSADEGGQINDTPSRAIYGQYKQLCLDQDQERFTIGGTATDSIYVINVNRARMREYLDEGNLELNLHALSGSFFLAGGGTVNAHTGSNVKLGTAGRIIRLVDDSRIANATVGEVGEVYNIVSGTIEDGVFNSAAPHYYGLLYKRLGVVVLDGTVLDRSASFLTVTGSEIPGDNAFKLYKSISGSALYTDLSGDYLGFQGRSAEKVKSTHYFVRVKNSEYNFSNNPSFVTGSEGDLAHPLMIGDPKVYITTVGLYNPDKELLAVAKTSKPIQKSFTKEALIKVKLEFVWIGMLFSIFLW